MPPAARPETASSAPARRRRIHEIDSAFHCMIVGSCLGVDELRKLVARVRSPLPPDATDFEVHACVVHAMGTAGAMAKLVQKRLDRKYRAQIQQCAKLATVADLRRWWDECAARGDFVGAFWAAMTHPAATGAFRTALFGEIHMLSHLEGATNRAFRRRLAAVERAAEAAAAEAADVRERLARAMTGNDALRDRIRRVEAENRRLSRLEDGAELRALQARAEALERLADRARTEGRAASGRLADHAAELRGRDDEIAALRRSLATAERECAALGDLLRRTARGAEEEGLADPGAAPIDLAGRGVVYVGGRASLLGHFRALVESANGRFIHHDGGVEDNHRKLGDSLGRGDVVLCPVDCVSHGACQRAKRFCKRTRKTFVPLRSSGLSSFADGLRRAAMA